MSVLGEAGGFEVEVTRHGNVELFKKPGWPQGDAKIMPPPQARALAALLVTAADEAERGKILASNVSGDLGVGGGEC